MSDRETGSKAPERTTPPKGNGSGAVDASGTTGAQHMSAAIALRETEGAGAAGRCNASAGRLTLTGGQQLALPTGYAALDDRIRWLGDEDGRAAERWNDLYVKLKLLGLLPEAQAPDRTEIKGNLNRDDVVEAALDLERDRHDLLQDEFLNKQVMRAFTLASQKLGAALTFLAYAQTSRRARELRRKLEAAKEKVELVKSGYKVVVEGAKAFATGEWIDFAMEAGSFVLDLVAYAVSAVEEEDVEKVEDDADAKLLRSAQEYVRLAAVELSADGSAGVDVRSLLSDAKRKYEHGRNRAETAYDVNAKHGSVKFGPLTQQIEQHQKFLADCHDYHRQTELVAFHTGLVERNIDLQFSYEKGWLTRKIEGAILEHAAPTLFKAGEAMVHGGKRLAGSIGKMFGHNELTADELNEQRDILNSYRKWLKSRDSTVKAWEIAVRRKYEALADKRETAHEALIGAAGAKGYIKE